MTPNSTRAAEIMLASTGRRIDVSESFIGPENYPNGLRSREGGRPLGNGETGRVLMPPYNGLFRLFLHSGGSADINIPTLPYRRSATLPIDIPGRDPRLKVGR